MSETSLPSNAIAIIGMAGRFPGAASADELWRLVREGREAIRTLSEAELRAAGVPASLLDKPNYVRRAATLDRMDEFDAGFFGFSPRDAAIMDPQHRHFLECAWEALERAGYSPEGFAGSIGVFGGCGMQAYFAQNLLNNPEVMASAGFFLVRHTGNDKDFLTTRVSYQLNLRGPSVSVQTACSTSLVAVHLACQSLLNRESDMALAGGVTIELPHGRGYLYEDGEILSPDGHCRAFDALSKGTVFGSGVGMVVLRRLEDAVQSGDHIHAVVLGSAVNNDGAGKVGYLAPSVDGQAAVIAEAIALAGVEADSITYIEAHGTGTPVGDPIEVAALTEAFGSDRRQFCGIGSIKTNIGHLDTAAGVASLIKAVSAVEHAELPPSLHFEQPNPTIDFAGTPFYVNARLQPWTPDGPRRAGVTSLGVGGTNAHVVIEQAPAQEPRPAMAGHHLLLLSARSAEALDRARVRLAEHLRSHPDAALADVAFTLHAGRRRFGHRLAAVAESIDAAVALLEDAGTLPTRSGSAPSDRTAITFMFPGGGAQRAGMAAALYDSEPTFRTDVDNALGSAARFVSEDLLALVVKTADPLSPTDAASALERPTLALPALFAVEYALARLLRSWGIEPDSFIGHSLGEYVAACLSGVMTLDDAIEVVAARARLFESLAPGSMVSVPLAADTILSKLTADLSIAAINGPELCVVSGPAPSVSRFADQLAAEGTETQRLRIDVAAHSQMLDPILADFRAVMRGIRLSAPQVPYVSNVTGTWITTEEATDPDYWVRHLRHTVQFAAGIATLASTEGRTFVEVGPGTALSTLARLQAPADSAISTLGRDADPTLGRAGVLEAAGRLWAAGAPLDPTTLHDGSKRRRVPLPTYPFEHQRYWIAAAPSAAEHAEHGARPRATAHPEGRDVSRWLSLPVWIRAEAVPSARIAGTEWLLCAERTGDLDGLAAVIEREQGIVTTVVRGEVFHRGENTCTADPTSDEQLRSLLSAARAESTDTPLHIVVGWAGPGEADPDRPLLVMLAMSKAIAEAGAGRGVRLAVLTTNLQSIEDAAVEAPEQALAAGAVQVITSELPEVTAIAIDLDRTGRAGLSSAGGPTGDSVARAVLAEVASPAPAPSVALRATGRWLPDVRPLPPNTTGHIGVRPDGAYLLTGGLGGMALTLAEELADCGATSLVLVSRRDLDASEPDERNAILDRIRAIEARGASVTIERVDIASRDDTRALVERVRRAYGGIHGVVHAAGVLDDALIVLKSADEARRVLRPKVSGAIALDEAIGETPLDFWINCSSVSAMLGLPGQIDYAAANAFLDAFAHWRTGRGRPTTSIDWQAWRDVGMLADAGPGGDNHHADDWSPIETGLFQRVRIEPARTTFSATLSASADWILDEHRLTGGEALLPGTGFVEMAIEAMRHASPDDAGAIELQDVVLLAPFRPGEAPRTLDAIVDHAANEIVMTSIANRDRVEHVRGTTVAGPAAPAPVDLAALEGRCPRTVLHPGGNLTHLSVGSHWQGSLDVRLGAGEAVIRASLPDAFAHEAASFLAHPALVDLATAGSFHVMEDETAGAEFFIPLSYGRIVFHHQLPAAIHCHARRRTAGGTVSTDVAELDLTITDSSGRVLLEIERFTARRMNPFAHMAAPGEPTRATGLDLSRAITPAEGARAFGQVLDSLPLARVVVGPTPLAELTAEVAALRTAGPSRAAGARRGDTAVVAPRDEVERQIAAIWSDLLGVGDLSIDDNFFELGGHSLLAAQLGARLRRTTGAHVPIAVLFERPTIAELARHCRESVETTSDEPALVAVPRDRMRRQRTSLDQPG